MGNERVEKLSNEVKKNHTVSQGKNPKQREIQICFINKHGQVPGFK